MPLPAVLWRAGAPHRRPSPRPACARAPRRRRSPSSASTVVSAVLPAADFAIRKWRSASEAIWGRCVMQSTWRPSASARRRSPTARAVWPPMPASTSSNTSVRDSPRRPRSSARASRATARRPRPVSRIGAAGTPGFGRSGTRPARRRSARSRRAARARPRSWRPPWRAARAPRAPARRASAPRPAGFDSSAARPSRSAPASASAASARSLDLGCESSRSARSGTAPRARAPPRPLPPCLRSSRS